MTSRNKKENFFSTKKGENSDSDSDDECKRGKRGHRGKPGKTILNGNGPPPIQLGSHNDFYIDTYNHVLYGPKTSSGWGSGISLLGPIGPQGPQGIPGPIGPPGPSGPGATNTILTGNGIPSSSLGNNGDYYMDISNSNNPILYGPKTSSGWGSGVSLLGPIGPQGPQGLPGPIGPAGANGTNGNVWLTGSGQPTFNNPPANVGDLYLDVTNGNIWQYVGSSTWATIGNIEGPTGPIGPAGTNGINGTNGTNGTNGNTIWNGSGAPGIIPGSQDGDFYIDTTNNLLYGPLLSGNWGTGISLIGPIGPTGPSGSGGSMAIISFASNGILDLATLGNGNPDQAGLIGNTGFYNTSFVPSITFPPPNYLAVTCPINGTIKNLAANFFIPSVNSSTSTITVYVDIYYNAYSPTSTSFTSIATLTFPLSLTGNLTNIYLQQNLTNLSIPVSMGDRLVLVFYCKVTNGTKAIFFVSGSGGGGIAISP